MAQAVAIEYPKLVRRLVLLDATTQLEPNLVSRAIDRVEQFLPLGLPLRSLSRHYDSRSMLHRIHCPTLVFVSPQASVFTRAQSEMIARRIPNAWRSLLKSPPLSRESVFSAEVQGLLEEFLQVPVKCPQKNLPPAANS